MGKIFPCSKSQNSNLYHQHSRQLKIPSIPSISINIPKNIEEEENKLIDDKEGNAEDNYKCLNLVISTDSYSIWKVKSLKIGLLRSLIRIEKNTPQEDFYKREINILKKLDHPSIIKIFETYENQKTFDTICEFNDGRKINDEINDIGPFSEKIAANVIFQLLGVVNYLHNTKGIIHTRINPLSVTVNTYDDDNEYYDIKLNNFGNYILKNAPPWYTKPNTLNLFTDENDTIEKFFVAPETIKGNNYDETCDIYSIGILGYYMITGKIPYFNFKSPLRSILSNNLPDFKIPSFEHISEEGIKLLKGLINQNPKKRISISNALKSKWFINLDTRKTFKITKSHYKKIITNVKKYNPSNKLQEIAIAYLVHNIPDIDDVRDINKVFFSFNLTYDGKMSKEQMKEGFDTHLMTKENEKKKFKKIIDDMFNMIDFNIDGFIEYEEFVRAGIDKKLFSEKEVLKFCFEFIDKDNSGKVSLSELKNLLSFDNKRFEEEIIKIKNDGNFNDNGGFLTFEVFEKMMRKCLI